MPSISQADLAGLAGVSRTTVTKAKQRGQIIPSADGTIDTDLPINAKWLKDKRAGIKGPQHKAAPAPKKPPKAAPPRADGPDDEDEDEEEEFALKLDDLVEKRRLTKAKRIDTEAQTRGRELAQAKHKGEHIPRELVDRRLGEHDAKLKTHLRDMPRRISAQVYAIAVSSGQGEVQAYLEREVGAAIAAALPE